MNVECMIRGAVRIIHSARQSNRNHSENIWLLWTQCWLTILPGNAAKAREVREILSLFSQCVDTVRKLFNSHSVKNMSAQRKSHCFEDEGAKCSYLRIFLRHLANTDLEIEPFWPQQVRTQHMAISKGAILFTAFLTWGQKKEIFWCFFLTNNGSVYLKKGGNL